MTKPNKEESRATIIFEFWEFLRYRKKWWYIYFRIDDPVQAHTLYSPSSILEKIKQLSNPIITLSNPYLKIEKEASKTKDDRL